MGARQALMYQEGFSVIKTCFFSVTDMIKCIFTEAVKCVMETQNYSYC